jgi:hypothetical protein
VLVLVLVLVMVMVMYHLLDGSATIDLQVL